MHCVCVCVWETRGQPEGNSSLFESWVSQGTTSALDSGSAVSTFTQWAVSPTAIWSLSATRLIYLFIYSLSFLPYVEQFFFYTICTLVVLREFCFLTFKILVELGQVLAVEKLGITWWHNFFLIWECEHADGTLVGLLRMISLHVFLCFVVHLFCNSWEWLQHCCVTMGISWCSERCWVSPSTFKWSATYKFCHDSSGKCI